MEISCGRERGVPRSDLRRIGAIGPRGIHSRRLAQSSAGPTSLGIIFFHVNQPFASLPEGVVTGIAVTRDIDGKKKNNNPPRIGLKYDMLTCFDHLLAPSYQEPIVVEETDFTKYPWKTRASDAIFLYGEDWFAAIDPDPRGLYGATVLSGRNGMQRAEDLGITSFGVKNNGKDKTCKMPYRPGPLEELTPAP